LRRPLVLSFLAALLVLATSAAAAASLRPIRLPQRGEITLPRVRHGVIRIPAGHASGKVTVLVGLRLPPLAARYGPGLQAFGPRRKLDMTSSASQAYLARLARAQAVAAGQIRRAVPKALIFHRYKVILDGFAVRLSYRDLPKPFQVAAAIASVIQITRCRRPVPRGTGFSGRFWHLAPIRPGHRRRGRGSEGKSNGTLWHQRPGHHAGHQQPRDFRGARRRRRRQCRRR